MGAESLWEPHTPVRPEPPPPPPPPPPAAGRPDDAGSVGRWRWPASPCSLLFIAGLGLMYVASERLGDNVARVQNAFGGLDEAQPASTDRGADVPAGRHGLAIRDHARPASAPTARTPRPRS